MSYAPPFVLASKNSLNLLTVGIWWQWEKPCQQTMFINCLRRIKFQFQQQIPVDCISSAFGNCSLSAASWSVSRQSIVPKKESTLSTSGPASVLLSTVYFPKFCCTCDVINPISVWWCQRHTTKKGEASGSWNLLILVSRKGAKC